MLHSSSFQPFANGIFAIYSCSFAKSILHMYLEKGTDWTTPYKWLYVLKSNYDKAFSVISKSSLPTVHFYE